MWPILLCVHKHHLSCAHAKRKHKFVYAWSRCIHASYLFLLHRNTYTVQSECIACCFAESYEYTRRIMFETYLQRVCVARGLNCPTRNMLNPRHEDTKWHSLCVLIFNVVFVWRVDIVSKMNSSSSLRKLSDWVVTIQNSRFTCHFNLLIWGDEKKWLNYALENKRTLLPTSQIQWE